MIEIETPVVPAVEPGTAGSRAVEVVDDDAAFASWYRNEHPRLLAAMTIVTNDLHTAQDVTAEAFARALAAWNRVSDDGVPDRVDVPRRAQRRAPPAPGAPRSSSARCAGCRRRPRACRPSARSSSGTRCSALPPRARTAVALRYAAGLTEAEVAEAMHVEGRHRVGHAHAGPARPRRRRSATSPRPMPRKRKPAMDELESRLEHQLSGLGRVPLAEPVPVDDLRRRARHVRAAACSPARSRR